MSPTQKYQELPSSDRESASSIVDESLEGEKEVTSRGKRRLWARVTARWWIVDVILVGIIVGLVIERQKPCLCLSDRFTEYGGDITGFAPRFSQDIMSFKPDLGFVPQNTSAFWDDEVREKWLSIVPRGLGYLKVTSPEKYHDLPTPIDDYPDDTVYTTSMPHQLHCLYNILEVYSAITSDNPHKVPTDMTFHLQHCFEYLRLSIMCCGDVALEGAQTTFPEGFPGSDGWDAQHVCRSYSEVYDYMDRNRVTDRVWIGGADEVH